MTPLAIWRVYNKYRSKRSLGLNFSLPTVGPAGLCIILVVMRSFSGPATNWGLKERKEEFDRKRTLLDLDVYSTAYDKSYNQFIPPGSYQLTRYATPKHMSFKMSQVDRTLWDLEMARCKHPEVLPQTLPDKSPALCQPRHPPVTLYDWWIMTHDDVTRTCRGFRHWRLNITYWYEFATYLNDTCKNFGVQHPLVAEICSSPKKSILWVQLHL